MRNKLFLFVFLFAVLAKNIGAYSIAFAKNTQRKAILEKEKPNRIVSDLMEIEEIVKEDLEWNVFVM